MICSCEGRALQEQLCAGEPSWLSVHMSSQCAKAQSDSPTVVEAV